MPFRTAGVAGSVTVQTKNGAGQLITPVSAPTVKWYTDAARTLGELTLTTTGSGNTYTASWTAAQAPASPATRYLKITIEVSAGVFDTDADDTVVFLDALAVVDGGLCTLQEVKRQLNKVSDADDDELQLYIDAVRAPIEDYCGPILQATVSNEVHNGCGPVIVLRTERVVGVTSLTEYQGTTANVYTQITTPASAGTYTYVRNGVILRRIGSSGYETPFTGDVYVTYTEGMDTVPAAVNLAARNIIQRWWETQRGNALSRSEDVPLSEFAFFASRIVPEMLGLYQRAGGMA